MKRISDIKFYFVYVLTIITFLSLLLSFSYPLKARKLPLIESISSGVHQKVRVNSVNKYESGDLVKFSFTLNKAATTSAGVFKSDGTLIRTLWSGVELGSGTYNRTWDGVDDDGLLSPNGKYNIKILSNNVSYTWEGVIGNTSDSLTGSTVHHAARNMSGMAIFNNTAYFSVNFTEQRASTYKFNLNTPQQIQVILNKGISTQYVCTDGRKTYWAGTDIKSTDSCFVFSTSINNDAEQNFAMGKVYKTKFGRTYSGAIDIGSLSKSAITGLAVEKKGEFIFVAHKMSNQIHVLNKETGDMVKVIPFSSPEALCVDQEDNLWVTYKDNSRKMVEKFAVRTDGSLLSTHVVLNGLVNPLAIAVSPDNSNILVADAGTSQQVKAFSNSSGSAVWSLGDLGGYSSDPNINNHKFYFSDLQGDQATFIAFQPDGSFWVEDPGNGRTLHFAASRIFIQDIKYRPISYSCAVDPNNPTRVFSDYLEYKIDYSKPLKSNNGSWVLVKNWGANIDKDFDDKYSRFKNVVTLNNNKTYTVLHDKAKRLWQLVELTSTAGIRLTPISFNNDNTQLYPDGSLRKVSTAQLGKSTTWTKQSLKGFDKDENPIWGDEVAIAVSPPVTLEDPVYWKNYITLHSGEITSSGVLVSFDAGRPPYSGKGWHLGGIKLKGDKWLWRTAYNIDKRYKGEFPDDGAYDNGNLVKNAGNTVLVKDNNIFWGYHGEFWKNNQVNKWNHVNDDGLLIGQFGITGPEVANKEAPSMMAGNALTASLVKENRNLYLYHNDESYHGGIHRWKINDLGSIKEQTIPVVVASKEHGLLAEYYEGTDFDNLNIKTTQIDPQVNFDWAKNANGINNLLNKTNFSIRWKGYIKPEYSELYTFYVKANTRLWVNGELLISKISNKQGSAGTAKIKLAAGNLYSICLENCQNGRNLPVNLSWSSNSQQLVVVPQSQFYPASAPDRSAGYDLLENLPHNTFVENKMYGWTRDPVNEDSSSRYTKWWNVNTNIKKYDRFSSPDIYAFYRLTNSKAVVMRNLSTGKKDIAQWSIKGNITFEGSDFNRGKDLDVSGKGGAFFEVLDNSNKVIVRLFFHLDDKGDNAEIYVNNKVIAQLNKDALRTIMNKIGPLIISSKDDKVNVKYANFPVITTDSFDTSSDARAPRNICLYFWSNGSNSDKVIGINNLFYSFK